MDDSKAYSLLFKPAPTLGTTTVNMMEYQTYWSVLFSAVVNDVIQSVSSIPKSLTKANFDPNHILFLKS